MYGWSHSDESCDHMNDILVMSKDIQNRWEDRDEDKTYQIKIREIEYTGDDDVSNVSRLDID